MKKLVYLFCVLSVLTGCKDEEIYDQQFSLGESVKVVAESSVKITTNVSDTDNKTALELTVTELSDSRCPSDVTCIWYGRAVVRVKLESLGVAPATAELCLGQCENNAFKEKDEVVVAGTKYKVTLLEVNPYPSTLNVKKQRYAVLKVDKTL